MKNKLWIFIFAFLVICPGKSLGDETTRQGKSSNGRGL